MIFIEKVNNKIGKKLKQLREKDRKTQKELALIFGVTPATISYYEAGFRVPSDRIKKKYALYFDISIEDIFFN